MVLGMPSVSERPIHAVPRTNWSGNYHYQAERVHQPTTVAEVQDAVRSETHARALGTRHCFNAIADSTGAQIVTRGLDTVEIERGTDAIRVGAGVRYGELALQLEQAGLALGNMASLPHISVGGAVATGTHGSGLANGNLSTAVIGLELVAANGDLHVLSRANDPERFAGAVVGLGALGIVTHLRLAVQPSYAMTQTVYEGLPFATLEGHLDEIMRSGYSVSLFTDWQAGKVNQVWIKRRVAGTLTQEHPAAEFFGATLATTKLHPLPDQPAEACTDQDLRAGRWYERLPHFKLDFEPSRGAELQSEYFVPFEHGYAAIRAVEALRDRIAPLLYVTELRAIAADDLWMSGQYARPSLGIHFTWKLEWEAVLQLLPAIEAALAPFAARPHWGKVFTMSGEKMRPLYPRLNDFRALASDFDPNGKFRNDFLSVVL